MTGERDDLSGAVREYFEERAAIMEYLGGLPRHEAERCARGEAVAYRDALKRRASGLKSCNGKGSGYG